MWVSTYPLATSMKRLLARICDLDIHMREVFRGASIAFVAKGLGAGVEFAFSLWLARMLGADGAGVFFLALSIAAIATVVGRVGLDATLLRYIAAGAGVGDWSMVKGVSRKGMLLAVAAATISSVGMYLFAPTLAETVFHKPELILPLRWMSLSVVPLSLTLLYAQMLRGLRHILASAIVDQHGLCLSLLSLLGLWLLGREWGVEGALWAHLAAAALTLLLAAFMWRALTPQLRTARSSCNLREMLRSCLPLFWVSLINMIITWSGSLALGIWASSADVGVFNVASRTAALTSFILLAVNSIASPKYAALYHKGDMVALSSLARNAAALMTLFAGPVLLFLGLFPQWVMGLFGPQFAPHGRVLVILAAGQFVNTITGSVGQLLLMSGHERPVRNNALFALVLNLVLNGLLTPVYGVVGAAWASAVCLASRNLSAAYLVRKHLGISTISLGWGLWKRRGAKGATLQQSSDTVVSTQEDGGKVAASSNLLR